MSNSPLAQDLDETELYDVAERVAEATLQNLVYAHGRSSGAHDPITAAGIRVGLGAIKSAFSAALTPYFSALYAKISDRVDIERVRDAVSNAAQIAHDTLIGAGKALRDDMYREYERISQGGKDTRETAVKRAARVAVTSAAGEMRDGAARLHGKTLKRWNTQRDARVRADHIYLEGMRISINEKFVTQPHGWKLDRPGDMTAPYEAWVGCRCFLTYTR